MNLNDYQQQALKTMADQKAILDRLTEYGPKVMQLQNGLTGLTDEVGELASVIKGHIEYGRPLDMPNVREEIGDALWRLGQIADAIGTDLHTCAVLNLDKLHRIRYKDGYSEEAANNRNLVEERSVLEEVTSMSNVRDQTGAGFAEPPEDYDVPEQRPEQRFIDYDEVRQKREREFKKRLRWENCNCTIIDFDFPNPTMRFSMSCPIHGAMSQALRASENKEKANAEGE